MAKFPSNILPRMLDGVRTLCPPPSWPPRSPPSSSAHPLPAGGKTVEQILERLAVSVAFGRARGVRAGRHRAPGAARRWPTDRRPGSGDAGAGVPYPVPVVPAIVVAVFALIFVAELPDKTMIATLIMGSRYRPVLVWVGAAAAFAVHVTVAVLLGRLLAAPPPPLGRGRHHRPVRRRRRLPAPRAREGGGGEGRSGGRHRRPGAPDGRHRLRGHLGRRVRRPHPDPDRQPGRQVPPTVSVFVGALAALAAASAVAAFGGRALLRVLPLGVIRRIGGVLLALLAVYSLVDLIRH